MAETKKKAKTKRAKANPKAKEDKPQTKEESGSKEEKDELNEIELFNLRKRLIFSLGVAVGESVFVYPDDIVVTTTNDDKALLAVDKKTKVARHIKEKDLRRSIVDWCGEAQELDPETGDALDFMFKQKVAISFVENLVSRAPKIERPKPVAFLSDPAICFHRVPFDPLPEDEKLVFPRWDSLLARMRNADAFCKRVGSIFDPDCDRSLATYVYGPGGCGKSTIQNALTDLLGGEGSPGVATMSGSDLSNRFAKVDLFAARICIVSEAPSKFLRSDEFKSLTGDGFHRFERKGVDGFRGQLKTLFWFFSNEEPLVVNQKEYTRRIIDCEMTDFDGELERQSVVLEGVKSELPQFITHCLRKYSTCIDGVIDKDDEELINLSESMDDGVRAFLKEHFIENPDFCCPKIDIKRLLATKRMNNSEQNQFFRALKRMGFKDTRRLDNETGERIRSIQGLTLSRTTIAYMNINKH